MFSTFRVTACPERIIFRTNHMISQGLPRRLKETLRVSGTLEEDPKNRDASTELKAAQHRLNQLNREEEADERTHNETFCQNLDRQPVSAVFGHRLSIVVRLQIFCQ